MQQGYRPPQSGDNPPRSRRTQRYRQPGDPANPQPPKDGFPDHERSVYQPGQYSKQIDLQSLNSNSYTTESSKKPAKRKRVSWWSVVVVLALVIGLIGIGSTYAPNSQPAADSLTASPTNTPTVAQAVIIVTNAPVTNYTATPNPISQTYSSETVGQKNAVSTAKSYLAVSSFSHQGLIEQLEYERFSHSDAVYGTDHCGADWNEQALKSAKSYLSVTAFSYSGLKDQLEYEGFTTKQAQYGVDRCEANWNEQAAKSAKSYLDLMTFSRDGLIEQLEYEGYTHSQAVYGATANGY